jgi:peptide-methionine (S)-S-oxide reductase
MSTRRRALLYSAALVAAGLAACSRPTVPEAPGPQSAAAPAVSGATATATFAGGCFWCVESDFDRLDGVLSTTSGYTGGGPAPTSYEAVSAGGTGHYEAVQIVYDPARISYPQLLDYFWRSVDPTDAGGQFCDRGAHYRTAIFVHDAAQRQAALASRAALEKNKPFPAPIVTELLDAGTFHPAEQYHQDYYRKNPVRYRYYRNGCGRDARVQQLWGKSVAH